MAHFYKDDDDVFGVYLSVQVDSNQYFDCLNCFHNWVGYYFDGEVDSLRRDLFGLERCFDLRV